MKKISDYIPHSVSQDPKTNLWFYDLEGGEGGGCETREECERLMVEDYEQVYGPISLHKFYTLDNTLEN